MKYTTALEKWHMSSLGLIVFGLAEAGLAYLFTILAINSAHTWQWALAVIFGIGTLQNTGRIILKLWQKVTSKPN